MKTLLTRESKDVYVNNDCEMCFLPPLVCGDIVWVGTRLSNRGLLERGLFKT